MTEVCKTCGGPLTDLCLLIEEYSREFDTLIESLHDIQKETDMTTATIIEATTVAVPKKRKASVRRAKIGKIGTEMEVGSVIVLDERGLMNGDRVNFRSTITVEKIEPSRDRQYFVVNGKYRYDRAGLAYFAV